MVMIRLSVSLSHVEFMFSFLLVVRMMSNKINKGPTGPDFPLSLKVPERVQYLIVKERN